ncbi:MAG TPA: VWA domain-containing protein [bacterium]|nr:VWA domain-containing protein [bacterium]
MPTYDQKPFLLPGFAANPDPRCACVLLLDVSGSMAGRPIEELASGVELLVEELHRDEIAARRVELAVVTFGPAQMVQDFALAEELQPLTLTAGGDTPMGAAIELGLDLLEQRKRVYKRMGIPYYRPWVFLISDGAPTDAWQASAIRIREGEAAKKFAFFPIGVSGANMDILGQIATRQPMRLEGLKFREFFAWLSSSLAAVSASQPGDEVELPSPHGWGSV